MDTFERKEEKAFTTITNVNTLQGKHSNLIRKYQTYSKNHCSVFKYGKSKEEKVLLLGGMAFMTYCAIHSRYNQFDKHW